METMFVKKPKIVLVDKEPHILEMLERALVDTGYDAFKASNPKEALSLIEELKPGLVITDMRVPDMNGIEFMRQIKFRDSDIEIIVVTGFATLKNAIQAFRQGGAFDFLAKPLDNLEQLLRTVKMALERWAFNKNSRTQYSELARTNEVLKTRLSAQAAELLKLNAKLQMEVKARSNAERALNEMRHQTKQNELLSTSKTLDWQTRVNKIA